MLIDDLSVDILLKISLKSFLSECGRRLKPYNVFKWWGRRFVVLSRAVLASLVVESEEELMDVVQGRYDVVRRYSHGKVIYDPFCGGGTIAIEASLMGFKAMCQDINVAAISVAKATYSLCYKGFCFELYSDLVNALMNTFKEVRNLWCNGDECILHVFACRGEDVCKVPVWLSTKTVNGQKIPVIIDENGYVKTSDEAIGLTPTHPCYEINPIKKRLPLIAKNVFAYAAEVYNVNTFKRRFISLLNTSKESEKLRQFLEQSYEKSLKELYNTLSSQTQIPLLKETRRLYNKGIEFFEELFTPRQLVTMIEFIKNSTNKLEASLIVANTMRTASLLAMYYQPYAKANPGLVIKSYWLPQNPVELNPIAFKYASGRLNSIGRGTLATYIKEMWHTCSYISFPDSDPESIDFSIGDSLTTPPPQNTFAIVTDPPYLGKQSYKDLSLLQLYALKLANIINTIYTLNNDVDTYSPQQYVKAMNYFANSLSRVKTGTPVIILMGMPQRNHINYVIKIIHNFANSKLGLINVYWVLGEAPGVLGRSRNYGILIMVFRKGSEITYENIKKQLNNIQSYKSKLMELLNTEYLHKFKAIRLLNITKELNLYEMFLNSILAQ